MYTKGSMYRAMYTLKKQRGTQIKKMQVGHVNEHVVQSCLKKTWRKKSVLKYSASLAKINYLKKCVRHRQRGQLCIQKLHPRNVHRHTNSNIIVQHMRITDICDCHILNIKWFANMLWKKCYKDSILALNTMDVCSENADCMLFSRRNE